jgi:hypothetical protein
VLLGCQFAHPISGAKTPRPDETKDNRLVERRQPKSIRRLVRSPFTTPLWHYWTLTLSPLRIDDDPNIFFSRIHEFFVSDEPTKPQPSRFAIILTSI